MSLARGFKWNYRQLQFCGYSLAGITTSLVFKNAQLCFDVGQGMPFQLGARKILLTHGHLDHAAGLPYLLSQREMMGLPTTEIYLPEELVLPMSQIIKLWCEIVDHGLPHVLHPARPGQFYELDKEFIMKPFVTRHRIVSQGYLVYRRRKRLRPDLRALGPDEIRRVTDRGEDPNEYFLEPLVAFTGDTTIEFLNSDEDVMKAKVLFMEVTFWDEKKSVESARDWGHVHIDEFIEHFQRLRNEKIVLIHASARYPTAYIQELLRRRLPSADLERVILFPRP